MTLTIEIIYPKLRGIIADVLVLEEDQIDLKSRLIGDLGAESIDFLDLVFQIEKEFNVKIPRGQLEKNARGDLSQEAFEQNGVLTPEGVKALKAYLNEVPEAYFKPDLKVSEIPLLFTVETFCKLIIAATAAQKTEALA